MNNKLPLKTIYAWYVVAVLMVCYTFSFVDRLILNLMIGPIRHDFNLSDTQVSLLIGFAFALFYTTMGIPLGEPPRESRRPVSLSHAALYDRLNPS